MRGDQNGLVAAQVRAGPPEHCRLFALHVDLEDGRARELELPRERLERPHGHALRPFTEPEGDRAAAPSERFDSLVVAERDFDDLRVLHVIPS